MILLFRVAPSQILPKLFRWTCSRLDKRSPVQPVSTLGYTSLYYPRALLKE
ncbi:MAG: hypothetical protein V7K40_34365 [Nostoc sp.]|uniref:hypothetical protein n=1 Tax=Nostoc sp. TaxID=1180 RepID=UPI002FF6EFEA